MSLGKTLKDVQRFSKKQSKKKNYLGWFQSFGGGESPINNAFFNMAMGSADGIAGAGEADGGIGMTASMGESLNEENETNIIDKVTEHFSTYNLVPEWKTFILPDGRYLNMDKLRAHSDVEQWLINNGLSKEKFAYMHMGSPTLSKLGCFRCNQKKGYCILPEVDYPTEVSLNTLLIWLYEQEISHDTVYIVPLNHKAFQFNFSEYTPDDILEAVREYYRPNIINEENESTPFTIESFKSNSGKDYVAEFLDSLDEMSRASVDTDLLELERLGTRAREPLSKPLGKGLFELRSKTPMGNVRILYFFLKGRIILLTNGFVKKTWAVPQDEIDIARRRMKEYTQRFGGK